MISIRLLILFVLLLQTRAAAAVPGLDTSRIDEVLGRSGQKLGEVYKVGFPRTDLRVTVKGVAVKPGLALGSWAAFSGSDDDATVMGDLVLLQDEINPVMKKLRQSGFEITSVHNHLVNETPRVMYMHYMGHGKAADIAQRLKAALAVSKTPLGKPAASPTAPAEPAFVKTVEDILGRKGAVNGGSWGSAFLERTPLPKEAGRFRPRWDSARPLTFRKQQPAWWPRRGILCSPPMKSIQSSPRSKNITSWSQRFTTTCSTSSHASSSCTSGGWGRRRQSPRESRPGLKKSGRNDRLRAAALSSPFAEAT